MEVFLLKSSTSRNIKFDIKNLINIFVEIKEYNDYEKIQMNTSFVLFLFV